MADSAATSVSRVGFENSYRFPANRAGVIRNDVVFAGNEQWLWK